MAKYHARNCSIYVDTTAGASTAISGDINTLELEMEAESPEVTGFGDNTVQRLSNGIIDWSMSLEGFMSTGATAAACILKDLLAGSTFVQVGPTGSTSGSLKFCGSAVLTNYSMSFGVNDAAALSCEIMSRSGSLSSSAW